MKPARDARGSRTNSETGLQTKARVGEWPTHGSSGSCRSPKSLSSVLPRLTRPLVLQRMGALQTE